MTTRKESPNSVSFLASKTESRTGAFAEEIASNNSVTGNLNSHFLYDQESEGPYQEMSKGASLNKYLEKIAMSGLGKSFHRADTASKANFGMSAAGLGMSAMGLGLSAASYRNGKTTAVASTDKANLERKSLTALNNINKTLSTATLAPSPMAIQRPPQLKKVN